MSRRVNELARGTEEELEQMIPDMSHTELSLLEKQANEYRSRLNHTRSCAFEVIGGHPDYRYFWWARAVFHEEIFSSFAQAASKFWTPVSESELPLMANSSNQAFKGVRSSFIENGNSVLHKRHIIFDEPEKEAMDRELLKMKNSISMATGFSPETPARVFRSDIEDDSYRISIY